MTQVKQSDLRRLTRQLEAAALLARHNPRCDCQCASLADHAHRVARQASGPLRCGGSEGHGKGDHADPTAAAAFADDVPAHWYERLTLKANILTAAVMDYAAFLHELGTVTATDPRELTKNGQGTCPACDCFCSGAENDRLVSGMCSTDYKAWTRAGRPERFRWVQERRGELAS